MIKLKRQGALKAIKAEIEKGNIYQLLTRKDNPKMETIFTIIKAIKDKKVLYTDYTIADNYRKIDDGYAPICGWNWSGYDFYMLNKEEAGRHLKSIIVNNLNETNKHK